MRRKLVFGAGLVLGALVALQLTFGIVEAHSRPVRFDPAPGAVLQSAPAQVSGWFTSDIKRDPNWSFIHVTDQQGNRVDAGDAQLSTDRRQMTVALKPGLAPGRYLVTWRTYDDSDGAIFGDCYTLFVGQAAADAAVSSQYRLDAGTDCQRIDVESNAGTPTASQVSALATQAAAPEEEAASSSD
ncbi:MAG TPA: copper resistance CopC family protein, partial [Dehalococcoidia bacterium]